MQLETLGFAEETRITVQVNEERKNENKKKAYTGPILEIILQKTIPGLISKK